jgi:drug/metabolite transporter (DMT)-like permease
MSRSLRAHVLLVLVTFIWGATFVVIKGALAEISPLLFNAVRMTLAAACLGGLYWRHIARAEAAVLRAGAVVGVFLWLGYEFQTSGLVSTTPSRSGFLTGVSVVMVPLFMALFWKRRVNRWTLLGAMVALVGMFLLTIPAGADAWGDWSTVNRGDVLTLACAVAFAFQIIYLGQATQTHGFEAVAFLQTAVAGALMWVTMPILERPVVAWSPRVVAAIVVTAVFGTAFAFSTQAWAQQFTPPSHTALIFSLEPVFAWLTSYVVLGERLGWRASFGAVLILGGVFLSEWKGTPLESPQSG